MVVADLDLDQVRQARQKIPNLGNVRDFETRTVIVEGKPSVGAVA